MPPLVSAIVPTYDRPETLRRALRSVDAQTYEHLEVVVVETPAEAGDPFSDLEGAIDRPLTHVRTDPDVGPSAARNRGVQAADGEYLAFLDDDDEWLPEKTRVQVERLEAAPERVAASVTGNVKVGPDGTERGTYLPGDPADLVAHQLCWNVGTFSMLLVRSTVPETVGGLDETLPRREDQDYLLRIARAFEVDLVREPLARKHSGGHQLSGDYAAAVRANERFREKHGALADEKGVREQMEATFAFMLGRTAMDNAEYAAARRHFADAIRWTPRERTYYGYLLAALGGPVTHRAARALSRRGIAP